MYIYIYVYSLTGVTNDCHYSLDPAANALFQTQSTEVAETLLPRTALTVPGYTHHSLRRLQDIVISCMNLTHFEPGRIPRI